MDSSNVPEDWALAALLGDSKLGLLQSEFTQRISDTALEWARTLHEKLGVEYLNLGRGYLLYFVADRSGPITDEHGEKVFSIFLNMPPIGAINIGDASANLWALERFYRDMRSGLIQEMEELIESSARQWELRIDQMNEMNFSPRSEL